MMDVSRLDFTRSQAFWLFLTFDGHVVGGLGAKLIDLAGETFESYLRRTSRSQYSSDSDPIQSIASPINQELTQKLIYIGELGLRKEHRGNLKILGAFAQVTKALCAMRWPDFNWMFAFVPEEHLGFIRCYDFTWMLPNAITWHDSPPEGRLNSHWIMATSRSHYEHVIAVQRLGSTEQIQA